LVRYGMHLDILGDHHLLVELEVPAGAIPEFIEADLGSLEIGDNVKISDVKLPSNAIPTITDRDFTIATIVGRGGAAETEGDDAEAEQPDTAEPEE
ncbi:MAG: hypothetical protein AAFQ18_05340, partial [Pseudomonadota bacterium]